MTSDSGRPSAAQADMDRIARAVMRLSSNRLHPLLSGRSADFRRTVYRHNLWARPLPDFTGRFRDCSPEFLRYNDSQIHRLIPWLHRDLHYLLNENSEHITYVIEQILELLRKHPIISPEFRAAMHCYFGERTDHFLHELHCFATTPYDITGYDRHVQYQTNARVPALVDEVLSSSDSDRDSDIVPVSSSHPAPRPRPPLLNAPAPGPSHGHAPALRYPRDRIPQPSATVVPIETVSHSDSDSNSSKVVDVGNINPPHQRTSELVEPQRADSPLVRSSTQQDEGRNSPPPKCAICLERCTNKSFTDSCLHQFCFNCLLNWSRMKTECPVCKQNFKSIIHNVKSNVQYEEYPVEQPQVEERPPNSLDMTEMFDAAQRLTYRLSLNRSHLLAASNCLSGRSAADFRRTVYRHNLWACPLPDFTGRFRDCSPEFLRYNDSQIHRLIPWLYRDLHYLLNENTGHITYVMERILELLRQHPIVSPEFRAAIHCYFGERTDHFLHEFHCFASTPYDITGYDRHVQYQTDARVPALVDEVLSSSDSDITLVSSSHPASAPPPAPGPSHGHAPALRYPRVRIPRPSATVVPVETVSHSDSYSNSSKVVDVGNINPPHQRTSELVELLGSDSDVMVQEPEPRRAESSLVKTECPLCKQNFKSIIHNVKSNLQYEEYPVEQPQVEERPPNSLDMTEMFGAARRLTYRISLNRPHPMAARNCLSGRSAADFRRTVYRHNLWARPLPDFTGRFRDCSPEFLRYNDSQIHRLISWLNRELHYLLNENSGHITYVMERILELLRQHPIVSPEFRATMHCYFGERTDHFLHEFHCFASTPYDITGYDRHVQYQTDARGSTFVNEVLSTSDSDIVLVSSSHPAPAPVPAALPSAPAPGPSHGHAPAPRYQHDCFSQPSATVVPIETVSHSDSDSNSSKVVDVGNINPPHQRTSELVKLLGSDSDVMVQQPEPQRADSPVVRSSSQQDEGRNSPPPNCAICLERCRNKSFTDSCLHQFCFNCLLTWSRVKTECPLCKQIFKSIIHNVKSDLQYEEYPVEQPQVEGRPPNSLVMTEMFDAARRLTYRLSSNRPPPLAASNCPSGRSADFRRTVYRHNLWACPLPDFTGRFRDCSPEYLRCNNSQIQRLIPWLNRDLHYLLNENSRQITYVMERILELLRQHPIVSPEFRAAMHCYFGERTDHFLHEFHCFASTPYDITGYDRHVQYQNDARVSALVDEVLSSSNSDRDS